MREELESERSKTKTMILEVQTDLAARDKLENHLKEVIEVTPVALSVRVQSQSNYGMSPPDIIFLLLPPTFLNLYLIPPNIISEKMTVLCCSRRPI